MRTDWYLLFTLGALYFSQEYILLQYYRHRYCRTGFQFGNKAPTPTQRYLGTAFFSTYFYFIIALITEFTGFNFWGLVSYIFPLKNLIVSVAGFVIGISGISLMIKARVDLGNAWRVGIDKESETLVLDGIYKYSRNPYFSGLLLFLSGFFLILPSTLLLFAFLQAYLLIGIQIRQEEEFLIKKHGARYKEYQACTGRFFPGIWKR